MLRPPVLVFPPGDCRALRRGRLHIVGTEAAVMVCAHVARNSESVRPYICAPMMAQGETLGLLYLQSESAGDAGVAPLSEAKQPEILREAARELRLIHEGKLLGAVTVSLGVACFPEHGRRREQLLQAADMALYQATDQGRNCVVVSNSKILKVVEIPQRREQAGR